MAINWKLHEQIRSMAAELRQEVYGTSGVPQWGTKCMVIEDVGVEIGDALACELIGPTTVLLPRHGDPRFRPRHLLRGCRGGCRAEHERGVADTLRYLQNQKPRMKYDEYRRQGLPITSSHIESTIKQIHRRVKGSEKFWSEGGADALLQLSADYLSDTDPLPSLWRRSKENAPGQRHDQTAS